MIRRILLDSFILCLFTQNLLPVGVSASLKEIHLVEEEARAHVIKPTASRAAHAGQTAQENPYRPVVFHQSVTRERRIAVTENPEIAKLRAKIEKRQGIIKTKAYHPITAEEQKLAREKNVNIQAWQARHGYLENTNEEINKILNQKVHNEEDVKRLKELYNDLVDKTETAESLAQSARKQLNPKK